MDPSLRTFGHIFRDAGYATAMAGKWQMCKFHEHPGHVKQCGFDEYCSWAWQFEGEGKMTESGAHVPLIVAWGDRIAAGTVCDDLVDLSDILPTLTDLTGVPLTTSAPPRGRTGKRRGPGCAAAIGAGPLTMSREVALEPTCD